MAVIGDLDEAAARRAHHPREGEDHGVHRGHIGRAGRTAMEIAGAAVAFIVEVAPKAPEAIGREAAIRLAGWLLDNRPAVVSHEITDPSGTSIKLAFANMAATGTGSGTPGVERWWRATSGAAAA